MLNSWKKEMKTFKQHILESAFLDRLVPALEVERHNEKTGKKEKKVLKGRRGWTHQDTAEHHGLDPKNPVKGRLGYWDTGKHVFHPKHGSEGLNIDSTRLKDTTERMSAVAMARRGMFEDKDA